MTPRRFSWSRIGAVMIKEFIQMRRDRLTFAMIIGVPIIQLVLFGYAINTDPKHLPTAVDRRRPRAGQPRRSSTGDADLRLFRHRRRRRRPRRRRARCWRAATSPTSSPSRPTSSASWCAASGRRSWSRPTPPTRPRPPARIGALAEIVRRAVAAARPPAPLASRSSRAACRSMSSSTASTIRKASPPTTSCPGLLGVILTMTTILMTALALTREVERGTMENLLAMPARPLEIMIGKIVPYIGFGFVQVAVILIAAQLLFAVPMDGLADRAPARSTLLFIAANVTLGYTISTLARNQMQAMQMTFFFFLPSILLSGFMFPFRGMPGWAQVIGEVDPAHPFPARRARRHAEGRRLRRGLPATSGRWPLFWLVVGDDRAGALPADAGLASALTRSRRRGIAFSAEPPALRRRASQPRSARRTAGQAEALAADPADRHQRGDDGEAGGEADPDPLPGQAGPEAEGDAERQADAPIADRGDRSSARACRRGRAACRTRPPGRRRRTGRGRRRRGTMTARSMTAWLAGVVEIEEDADQRRGRQKSMRSAVQQA